MNQQYDDFRTTVWEFYDIHGRDELPWRKTTDPYAILVSEVMLQQTQVARVTPKYRSWMDEFPSFSALADANLSGVLELWQGLGYNRRAKYLKQSAEEVIDNFGGELPKDNQALQSLPGIGPYTAGAIQAFAHNLPVVFVETNVRSVYLHHFFEETDAVSDDEIESLVEATLDEDNPREWYWALMDYGTYIKDEHGNPNKKSQNYSTQSQFEGSNRQLRSKILRYVMDNQPVSIKELENNIEKKTDRQKSIAENLSDLTEEDMIEKTADDIYRIPQ